MFKFNLGAKVVLVTSLAAIAAVQRNEEEAKRDRERAADGFTTLRAYTSPEPIEAGTVIGRAEYVSSAPSYFVRYRAGDGRQVEEWVEESGLALDPRDPVEQAVYASDNDWRDPEPARAPAEPDAEEPETEKSDTRDISITREIEHTDGTKARTYINIPTA